mmetsp:Transcript_113971/g.157939  ORF Transcript_113971/g.157939 Transcript_113971/m.157939 type:complete len:237 (+) Transcript_113971:244-954(+)
MLGECPVWVSAPLSLSLRLSPLLLSGRVGVPLGLFFVALPYLLSPPQLGGSVCLTAAWLRRLLSLSSPAGRVYRFDHSAAPSLEGSWSLLPLGCMVISSLSSPAGRVGPSDRLSCVVALPSLLSPPQLAGGLVHLTGSAAPQSLLSSPLLGGVVPLGKIGPFRWPTCKLQLAFPFTFDICLCSICVSVIRISSVLRLGGGITGCLTPCPMCHWWFVCGSIPLVLACLVWQSPLGIF